MPWFKVDDQLDGNKKVKSIPRRNRTKAIGLWALAGSFCARELTDGFVPDYMIEDLASTHTVAGELVTAGMWERVESGYKFVNWKEYQPTSDEVREQRRNQAERQRRSRERRLSQRQEVDDQQGQENVTRDSSVSHGVSHMSVTRQSQHPDPTRPDPSIKNNPPLSPQGGTRTRQAIELPDGWMPQERTVTQIREEDPRATDDFLTREHRKFSDYWAGVGGQRGRKKDWDATWRNWMRRALETQPATRPTDTMTAPDRKILGYHEAAERVKRMRGEAS